MQHPVPAADAADATTRAAMLERHVELSAVRRFVCQLVEELDREERLIHVLGEATEGVGAQLFDVLWPGDEFPDGPDSLDFYIAETRSELLAARLLQELVAHPERAQDALAQLLAQAADDASDAAEIVTPAGRAGVTA